MMYLDHASTSPLLPEVREAMAPWWGAPANPGSAHRAGQRAASAVEAARAEVAALLERPVAGVVFGSGATEANHHALRIAAAQGATTVAVSGVEHPCVSAAAVLAGLDIRPLAVDGAGRIEVSTADADVLCCMAVNHETGVRQDVAGAVAQRAAGRVRHVHCDAAQALGKGPVEGLALADTVVASAHKLGGPAGVGALSLLNAEHGVPLFGGGGQERGLRSGTVNVAGVVGFGVACRLAQLETKARLARWTTLARKLRAGLRALGAREMGEDAPRVPTHTCVVFDGIEGETLVQALDLRGFALSSGSACASGSSEPSPVLIAMGEPDARGALRISLGPHTSVEHVDALLAVLPEVLGALREFG
ncbi:MAG: aminotransferase class V-fold PLP-dependent enzyme [Myxococcota bacterium]